MLSARDARRGLIVVAACRDARALGIRAQMSLSEAVALSQKRGQSPSKHLGQHLRQNLGSDQTRITHPVPHGDELQVVEHDAHEDMERLCQLAEEAQQFSPIVGLEPIGPKPWAGSTLHQPQGLMLDIRGLGLLFGSEEAMAEMIRTWLAQQGYQAVIGIADTVGAAWALSHYGWKIHNSSHALSAATSDQHIEPVIQPSVDQSAFYSARSSSESAIEATEWDCQEASTTFDSQDYANPRKEILRWYVEPLPVEALRLEGQTIHKMHRLGIFTIADLLQLPRSGLASRLGEQTPTRVAQILGDIDETFPAWRPLPDFCIEQKLEYPTDRQDSLSELLRRMIATLASRLRQQGKGALRITCCLKAVEAQPRLLQLGLFRPTAEAGHMHTLLASQLERHWEDPAMIEQVTLQVTLAEPLVWQQPELFDSDTVKHRRQLALFLDAVSNRLGRNQVLQPIIEGDPIPESTVIYRPWTGRRNTGLKQDTANKLSARWNRRSPEPTPQDPLRRPLKLFSKPQPVHVESSPEDHQPLFLGYQGRRYRVIRCWGPERLESGWWRGPSQRRDYYRIEIDDQRWLWVFYSITEGSWQLHGSFD